MKLRQIRQDREKGAAIVMVMFSLIIMTVLGLAITFNAGNEVRGSKNELLANQAYYAAEAGLQDAVNVLRGYRCPLGVTNCSPTVSGNSINFQIAVNPATSNRTGDTYEFARLSRWLPYADVNGNLNENSVVFLNPDSAASQRLAYKLLIAQLANGDYELVSTGYAPLGAQRTLRMRINSPSAQFLDLPAVITMLGNVPSGTGGPSHAHTISGVDASGATGADGKAIEKPLFAVVGAANVTALLASLSAKDKPDTLVTSYSSPVVDLTGGNIPFDNSAKEARKFIKNMEDAANTIVENGSMPTGALGTRDDPTLVVVKGDISLNAVSGAGIMIVTGELTLSGNVNYDGYILVLGKGKLIRRGAGSGDILGGILLAAFSNDSDTFNLTPVLDTRGGGNSLIQYQSRTNGGTFISLIPPMQIKSVMAD